MTKIIQSNEHLAILYNCLILMVIYRGLKSAFIQHKMFSFMAPFDNNDKKLKTLLAKTFYIAQTSRQALRPNQPPIQLGLGDSFPRDKAGGSWWRPLSI
jgi:hypothetical protein